MATQKEKQLAIQILKERLERETGKKIILKEAKAEQIYTIERERNDRKSYQTGTLAQLINAYSYTLEKGQSWERERGNKKINRNPKSIDSLVSNLYNAENNAAANGYSGYSFRVVPNETNPNYKKDSEALQEVKKERKEETSLKSLYNQSNGDELLFNRLILKAFKENKISEELVLEYLGMTQGDISDALEENGII
jgi:hypothetical protein